MALVALLYKALQKLPQMYMMNEICYLFLTCFGALIHPFSCISQHYAFDKHLYISGLSLRTTSGRVWRSFTKTRSCTWSWGQTVQGLCTIFQCICALGNKMCIFYKYVRRLNLMALPMWAVQSKSSRFHRILFNLLCPQVKLH